MASATGKRKCWCRPALSRECLLLLLQTILIDLTSCISQARNRSQFTGINFFNGVEDVLDVNGRSVLSAGVTCAALSVDAVDAVCAVCPVQPIQSVRQRSAVLLRGEQRRDLGAFAVRPHARLATQFRHHRSGFAGHDVVPIHHWKQKE